MGRMCSSEEKNLFIRLKGTENKPDHWKENDEHDNGKTYVKKEICDRFSFLSHIITAFLYISGRTLDK